MANSESAIFKKVLFVKQDSLANKRTLKRGKRSALSFITLVILLLSGIPAQAMTYVFANTSFSTRNLPSGCTGPDVNNKYTCGALTLQNSDILSITTFPTTIQFNGLLTTNTGSKINFGGSAANLNIILGAALNAGASSTIVANITGTAAINIGASSLIGGTIKTTSSTGVVTIGGTVLGDITTDAGGIAVNNNTSVNLTTSTGNITVNNNISTGNMSTGGGNITTGNNCTTGNITTGTGSVSTGNNCTVGNITTGSGTVTSGNNNTIGKVTTGAGAITIWNNSIIGSIISDSGNITLKQNGTEISGDITNGAGAINIENNAIVCGNLIISRTGTITLSNNVQIGGNVTNVSGAITIGNNSTVAGNILSQTGTLSITKIVAGGNISSGGTVSVTNSYVQGTVSGGKLILKNSTTNVGGTPVTLAACATTPVPPLIIGSTSTGLFDCLETGSNAPSLFTKQANTPFAFDIAALKTDKSVNSTYVATGGTPKNTRVELFDDTVPPASCSVYTAPVASQIVTFTSTDSGRKLSGAFNLSNVYKKLRCRVTECTTSACTQLTLTTASCSSDQFSVRPIAPSLVTSANALAPSATSTPIIKAGANFTLTPVTTNLDNYLGLLALDNSKVTAQLTSQDTTQQSGGVVGTLTPSSLIANTVVSNNVNYNEVGYLYLAPGAFRDDSFTAVDSFKGDCITSTASDSYLSTVLIGAQYGCSIGNINPVSLGRFVPDHFGVTGALVTRSDLQTTESQTVPFTYMEEPMQLALTVSAYNKGELATYNYQGKFAKLNTSGWSISNWLCAGVSNIQCMGLSASNGTTLLSSRLALDTTSRNSIDPSLATPNWINGLSHFSANIKIERNSNADGPYDNLKLGAKPLDLDGVTLPPNAATDNLHCVNLNTKTGIENANCAFGAAIESDLRRKVVDTSVRLGRLHIANAYGSELLDLPILVETQYWNGSSFVTNILDNTTILSSNNVITGNYQGSLSAANITTPNFRLADTNDSCTASSTISNILSGGKSCLLLSKPSVPGSVNLLINLGSLGSPANCLNPTLTYGNSVSATLPYLSGNWCGTTYDRDPTAQATLGVYKKMDKHTGKNSTDLIYLREVY